MKISHKLQRMPIGSTMPIGVYKIVRLPNNLWQLKDCCDEISQYDNTAISKFIVTYYHQHRACCGLNPEDVS